MKRGLTVLLVMLGLHVLPAVFVAGPVQAEFQLPSYSQGENVETQLQSKGKKITDTVSLGVGIIAILALLVGGGFMAFGNAQQGRSIFFGGVIAILIASMVYGIAALVAS